MKKINTNIVFGLLWSLIIPQLALAQDITTNNYSPTNNRQTRVVKLRPDDITTIVATRGIFSGNVNGDLAVSGFDTPNDAVTWIVNAPKEDDYAISIIYSMKDIRNIEVSCGESVIVVPSITRTWEWRPFHWRQEFPETLHLKAGENKITLRLPDDEVPTTSKNGKANKKADKFIADVTDAFHLFSIELGTPKARKDQLARAKEIRGDASWMKKGKYGLFIHWSALSHPYHGDQPRAQWFQKSVEMFNVKVFADAIERTGAAWITFTATHKGFYWPAPNAALDNIIKGRTSKRDLLSEIINELDKRGIKTLFYLHTGYNGYEKEFRIAAGANDANLNRFSENIEAILRECSLRYGDKLKGFGYIDGSLSHDYPLDPWWEGWARAIKAGNPKAILGFSSNRGPSVSPFSELSVTDGGARISKPNTMVIGPGKQLGDVTPVWWCLMDEGGWFAKKSMNGEIGGGPIRSTKEYVDFFQKMAEKEIPVTINLMMTADVTDEHPIFNPECMAVMEEVRKAIRGK